MAVQNYFDPDERPVPQDTQSTDNSKSGVRAAWDAWTSKPENNAALLQFGISMLQPRPTNQTTIGQLGTSIGDAAEASTRNIAAQQAELDREAQREERLSTAEYRSKQGDAALINARAYDRATQNNPAFAGGAGGARTLLSAQLRTQQAFRAWLAKPEDPLAASLGGGDPLVTAVGREFPGIKSKADLIGNPAALRRAAQIYSQQFADPADTDAAGVPPAAPQPAQPGAAAAPAVPTPSAPAAPAQPMTRTFYDKKTGKEVPFQWDGTKWIRLQ